MHVFGFLLALEILQMIAKDFEPKTLQAKSKQLQRNFQLDKEYILQNEKVSNKFLEMCGIRIY